MRETQPARTRLAWRRTVLAAAVVGLLLGRLAVERGAWWLLPIIAAVWLVGAIRAQARIAGLTTTADRPHPPGSSPYLVVLVIAGYATLGAALMATR